LSALRELGLDKRESNTEHRMNDNAILVVAADASHHGRHRPRISKAEPSNTALLVLAVLLYGTLVLSE